jgi:predicted ATPase
MNRLGRRQGADLVAQVAGAKPLPAEIVEQIVARTDGVPLFVEELTKTVLESGLLADAGDRYELSGPAPPFAIPMTLHDSLMARLDRLAPIREVAQIGAVIGRELSHGLLATVAGRPEEELRVALDQLVASALVFRRGMPPDATYSFKHALVQDAAYQSLLRSRRQQLHGRIAAVLEKRLLEAGDAQPELVAHHCTEAGLCEKAIEYWHQAGRLASERAALVEAISHFCKALDLLGSLREPSTRIQREIDLHIALGGALIAAKGYAAPETGRAYARAGELCREAGDLGRLFPLLFGQLVFHMARAEHAAAQEIAAEALRSANRDGDVTGLVVGHRAAGISALWCGELLGARRHLEQELALYDPERHRSLATLYAYDPRLGGLAGLAFGLLQLGYPERGVARCREAIDEAKRLAHPAGQAFVLHHACMVSQALRDGPGVREHAAALVGLSAEHGFALWQAAGIVLDGWALAETGHALEGIARIEDGLDAYRATGAGLFVPYFLGLLATAHGAAGETAKGQRLLAEALDAGHASGERWFEAELYRLKGSLASPVAIGPRSKSASRVQSRSPASRAPGCGSCAPRPASQGFGLAKASEPRHPAFSHRSMAGSPRASTAPTSGTPRRCSTS